MSGLLGVHGHDTWSMSHPAAPPRDDPLDRSAGFRIFFERRIRHPLLHLKSPPPLSLLLRNCFVGIRCHVQK